MKSALSSSVRHRRCPPGCAFRCTGMVCLLSLWIFTCGCASPPRNLKDGAFLRNHGRVDAQLSRSGQLQPDTVRRLHAQGVRIVCSRNAPPAREAAGCAQWKISSTNIPVHGYGCPHSEKIHATAEWLKKPAQALPLHTRLRRHQPRGATGAILARGRIAELQGRGPAPPHAEMGTSLPGSCRGAALISHNPETV